MSLNGVVHGSLRKSYHLDQLGAQGFRLSLHWSLLPFAVNNNPHGAQQAPLLGQYGFQRAGMPYTTVDDNCLTLALIQLKADLKRTRKMILAHTDIELRSTSDKGGGCLE